MNLRSVGQSLLVAIQRREVGLGVVLIALVGAVGIINPAFLNAGTVADTLGGAAPTVILACAAAIVILTGEIDVSIGSLYGVLAVVLGLLSSPGHAGCSTGVTLGATLGAGAAVGLLNGTLIGCARLPSIIVTLGMMAVLRGIAELSLGGVDITDLPAGLRRIGTGRWLGLDVSVWAAGLVTLGAWALLRRTRSGLRLYASGDNPEAAGMAGVRVSLVKLGAFAVAGALVAVAVIVSVPQLPKVEAGLGVGYELLAISAAVVGGVSVRGGVGTIGGAVLGALVLSAVRPALLFLKLGSDATFWERAIQGAFILAAVGFDHAVSRRPEIATTAVTERGPWRTATAVHGAALGLLTCIVVAVAGWLDRNFVAGSVQSQLLTQASEVALLAAPMALVMLSGGIDLSVGSVMALAAVVIGTCFERGVGAWAACAIGVFAAGACGLFNGVLIARVRMHPLIVTLATMALFRGVAEGLSGARPVSGFPESFLDGAEGSLGPIPVLLLPAVVMLLLAWSALRYTVPGWMIRAAGFNEVACRYGALGIDRLKIAIYTLSGVCAGLGAVLLVLRRNTAKADAGQGIELDVITAVVLGGISVSGGRGSVVGVALGVLLLHELRQFIGWRWQSDEVVPLVIGAVLIAATAAGKLGAMKDRGRGLKA